jgi:hypothetical protein
MLRIYHYLSCDFHQISIQPEIYLEPELESGCLTTRKYVTDQSSNAEEATAPASESLNLRAVIRLLHGVGIE